MMENSYRSDWEGVTHFGIFHTSFAPAVTNIINSFINKKNVKKIEEKVQKFFYTVGLGYVVQRKGKYRISNYGNLRRVGNEESN